MRCVPQTSSLSEVDRLILDLIGFVPDVPEKEREEYLEAIIQNELTDVEADVICSLAGISLRRLTAEEVGKKRRMRIQDVFAVHRTAMTKVASALKKVFPESTRLK